VVPGGKTGQESIYNGLKAAASLYPADSIVLVHDGVRPLVDPDTITAAVACAKEKGNAVTVTPAIETIFLDNSTEGQVGTILDRKTCHMAKAPQCFHLGDLLGCHEKAIAEGKDDFIDSASMVKHYGHELYTVEGKSENIKITTPIDYYMFRAIIDARENSQIFGL
jgi:2-C-methyl-D-erythritol 4-phosphate cytidylyltransferase